MSRPSRPLALVTGASRGIGRRTALALAADHDLLLVGRNEATLAPVAEEVRQQGTATVSTFAADLADTDSRTALVEALRAQDPPVRVLVNNAGVAVSSPLHKTDAAGWASTLELNLAAPFWLTQVVVPAMKEARWGRIINIASTAALKGYRYTAAYSASKGGLVALTRALAAELSGRGITVNAICPGFTDTSIAADAVQNIASKTGRSADEARANLEGFSPLGRLVDPAEVAAMVAYLASDAAAAVNGQTLAIDGGETTQ
ncbi:MAG: SDR family oxidoreductase [Myxococcota bacterium]